ncbi:MAG: PASTA domain-containing protein [Stomatobaculum sp.]|nr:PASTA domain-containing protein [Stomatobaculum sp.]
MSNRLCMGCMEFYDARFEICPRCGYIHGTKAQEAYHLQPGTVLRNGRYVVGRVLGFGGFGVTYIGYDRRLQQKVAVKEYLPGEFSTRMPGVTSVTIYSGEREEQFAAGKMKTIEEAVRLAKFRQLPNIVHVFDTFEENNTAYIVMEFCDGESIKSILERQGPMSLEEALIVVLGVAEGLKPVHAEGMIHRDISPDNIYRLKDGTVKILDFGAARYATTKHSKSLSVIIKPGYAPEEQYRSRGDQGPWTDVYALAATFYKMITGITPPDAMERAARDTLVRPSEMGIYMQEGMETALMNAMNVAIEDRTSSLDQFEKELLSADVEARKVTDRKTDVGKVSGRFKVAAALASGLAAVVIAGVLLLNPASPVSPFTLPDNTVWTPTLVNLDLETAEKTADEAWLKTSARNMVYSDTVEKGLVLHQSPEAGTQIVTDRKTVRNRAVIEVDVSAGPEVAYVPAVTFMSRGSAGKELEKQGFSVEYKETSDQTKASGTVTAQHPAPGKMLYPGAKVTLTVVKDEGQLKLGDVKNITVPDVTGMLYEEAEKLLREKKLASLIMPENSDTVPENVVMAQDHEPGIKAAENEILLLTVSSGKEKVLVPLVTLKTKDEAERLLREAGFLPEPEEAYSSSVPAGNVVSQKPEAQEQAEKGAPVRIVISKGEDPEETARKEAENKRRMEKARETAPPPRTEAPRTEPAPVTEAAAPAAVPETEAAPPETEPQTTAAPETLPAETAPQETAPPQTEAPPETAAAATAETTKPYIHTGKTGKIQRKNVTKEETAEDEEKDQEDDEDQEEDD